MTADFASVLGEVLRPGMTVAVGDGVGAIRDGAALSAVARDVGSLRLVLGWLPAPIVGIDPDCFADVVALMPGWGVRDVLSSPKAHFVPTRLAAIPALLAGAHAALNQFAEQRAVLMKAIQLDPKFAPSH